MAARILVVDDEPGIRETLAAILRVNQYVVEVASDGIQGYQAAGSFAPDLVISDVVMPNRNGIEMAILIADNLPKIKILLISGQAVTKEFLKQAHERGYDFSCLAKPVHPTDLLQKVSEILATS
jgi:CheY-like chemotaxis protein